MTNNYLYIEGNTWNYCDGVFNGIDTIEPKKVSKFCFNHAVEMRHSTLGNYSKLSKEERERLAVLWEAAKNLPEGKYDYYFNLEDKKSVFIKAVKELAEKLGIEYNLRLQKD